MIFMLEVIRCYLRIYSKISDNHYELDPAHFVFLPCLVWQACLKKTIVELELLTDYDMVLWLKKE